MRVRRAGNARVSARTVYIRYKDAGKREAMREREREREKRVNGCTILREKGGKIDTFDSDRLGKFSLNCKSIEHT